MNRFVLSICAVAMLAGCGTFSPVLRQAQDGKVTGQVDRRGASWMAADVAGKDLLYVSSAAAVTIYSYPQGKLEGTIHTGFHPSGE